MITYEVALGTVNLSSNIRLAFSSLADRKLIRVLNDNSGEGNVPQNISVLLRLLFSLLKWNSNFWERKCAGVWSRGISDDRIRSWFNHSEYSAKNLSFFSLYLSHLQNILLQQLYGICLLLLWRLCKTLRSRCMFQRQFSPCWIFELLHSWDCSSISKGPLFSAFFLFLLI